jgi:GAF domain-containing protein
MRRRAKPAKAKVEAKPTVSRKVPKNEGNRVRDLEKRLAEALKREAEALEQQTATSEILRVISSSPTDVQPVLDAVAESAARLCAAEDVAIFEEDAGVFRALAVRGADVSTGFEGTRVSRDSVTGRALLDRQLVHIHDITTESEFPVSQAHARRAGNRTMLAMPLLREGMAIGVIFVRRPQVRPFSAKQIALLRTFADQAVIAIENVRLFTETKEALEQQTATAGILRVISSSPTDVQPVFDAIAAAATTLCAAENAGVFLFDGTLIHFAAHHHWTAKDLEAIRQTFPRPPGPGTVTARAILTRAVAHTADIAADPGYELRGFVDEGFHAILSVPMLRDGGPIGAISVTRREAVPFTERQIALLKTFADQAVIAIENVRLFKELEAKNRALTEAHARVTNALEQQTATGEILGVISSSPTDVQPVFDTIVRSAVRLCGGLFSGLYRFDGELIHQVAQHNFTPEALAASHRVFPARPSRGIGSGRAILERAVVQIPDIERDPEYQHQSLSRAIGFRSAMYVPMLREGAPVGVIVVARAAPGLFSDDQTGLLKTFADQAVIAIENVRLFKELEARNRDLTVALEQQTATAEILRVISNSPTEVQPVFDAIATSSTRLCEGLYGLVFRFDGEMITLVADYGSSPERLGVIRRAYPAPPGRRSVAAQAILERRVIAIADAQSGTEYPHIAERARAIGYRSILSVPMLQGDTTIGAINVLREEAIPFTDAQIELLKTFADQAVIAIENVRLFTELQASNRGLTSALDTQSATSDILRVISRSQTNVQPVFDAILGSAVRLLRGYSGVVTRIAGDQIALAALTSIDDAGDAALRALFPQSLQSEGAHAQAIRDRAPINITDAQTDPRVPEAVRANARARGYRSWITVPLLHHDEAVGAIAVTRRDPGGFTDDEIALLRTFADQAVIAIENARLLTELQTRTQELTRSVGELQALGEVGQAISSTLDLQTVLSTIVARATQLTGVDAGVIYEYDEQREVFEPRATERLEADIVQMLVATPVRKGQGATGRLAEVSEPIQLADLLDTPEQIPVRDVLLRAGYRALLAVPLVRENHLIGGLTVFRKAPGEFAPGVVELLQTFATQSALAIQNARLFRELADKSRQLEVVSQHKSEFLANMSHELRTPLNAILGFSEVLTERMFGDLNEKQEEYLKDIHASGQHLLALINDILDLSKIEAGRMELEVTDFHLPEALNSALTFIRERAGRREIALHLTVDERLNQIQADERKVRQIVLNLLSNAIKFTPEGGRIEVRAMPTDGCVEVSVSDTGVGIAPEDQEAVFEEFRQVGTAAQKVEGTGLGLALSRKFVELHGGRIWVKSQIGQGSTFTFTLPLSR